MSKVMKTQITPGPLIRFMIAALSVVLVYSCFYAQSNLDRKVSNDTGRSVLIIGSNHDGNTEKTVPIHDGSVSNIEEERYIVNTKDNPPSVSGKKEEYLYHQIILQTASLHKIDPALVKAIIMAESGYNPRATSEKGAKGLMQLMPGTAKALGVEDVFDPHQNIIAGVRYFKQLVSRFNGDVKLALAAYNAGSKNVRRYKGIPPFKGTQYYIKKVFKYYQLYKNQMSKGIDKA